MGAVQMPFQVNGVRVGSFATLYSAFIRFVAGVNAHMDIQLGTFAKCLIANFALVWFESGMHIRMAIEM